MRGVAHGFGDVDALGGIDAEIQEGEVVAIVGPSGCGKSTLLELIAGLDEPSAGTIAVGGRADARSRLDRCAWMPQRDLLLPWRTSTDNAALGLRLAGGSRRESRKRAGESLGRLGLGDFASSYPGTLSGGMRQRVAFARALLTGNPVLLLDEPLASLDAINRADLQGWLVETLAHERRTTVMVTHDVEEALFVGERVLLLSPRPGRVVWEARSPVRRDVARPAAISEPSFVAAKEAALEALAGAMA